MISLKYVASLAIGVLFAGAAVAQSDLRPVDKAARISRQGPPQTTNKIVGGKEAPQGAFPFQVALIRSDTPIGDEQSGQFCGGALIAPDWVLTAAHCVPLTRPEEVDVYVGSSVLPSGEAGVAPTGIRRALKKIISHQHYVAETRDNDIALLHLADPAPDDLDPALLPQPGDPPPPLGTDVTVLGWGATQEGGGMTPKLRSVVVKVQDSPTCLVNYRGVVPSSQMTSNMLCAGLPGGGADSCQGDSGGFLGAPASSAGRWVEVGISSWGLGCARPNLFGVYTRVANYLDWITAARQLP